MRERGGNVVRHLVDDFLDDELLATAAETLADPAASVTGAAGYAEAGHA